MPQLKFTLIGGVTLPRKIISSSTTVFKNRPLVRCDNIIYYGNISDKCVAKLEILSNKAIDESDISDNVKIQLLSTDQNLNQREKIMKQCKRNGLYEALDVADAWLCKVSETEE